MSPPFVSRFQGPGARRLTAATFLAIAATMVAPATEPAATAENKMQRNRLGDEKSPYLLQHKDNPVWWQPWGEAAFEEARGRNVPVFLSVGYSTCHWCHVMEHESFEDEGVAAVLNRDFVAIKVDREERPDVDALYMDAVHALGRRGGWPMSVWMTPEGRPFAAGTYFPKPAFLEILATITRVWTSDPASVGQQADAVIRAVQQGAGLQRAGSLDHRALVSFEAGWEQGFDPVQGGRRGAPKFPPAYDLQLLLRIARRGDTAGAAEMAALTLDRMAASGMYDHLGGGFHRYSTDETWLVPHFEKMLYDQASLVLAYTEGWQLLGRDEYRLVVDETIGYVLRDLTHPEGGFYSAEDADSEGEEGKFYVWTPDELKLLLSQEERAAITKAFGVTDEGNFEARTTIFALQDGHERVGRSPLLAGAMKKLFDARARRIRPHLDDKILADWNGLMIAAMARAGQAFDEARYVDTAARAMRFVLARLRDERGNLLHRWRDGDAAIPAFLDDYAFVVHALIELHQATQDPAWIDEAAKLFERQDALFRNDESGDYYSTDGSDGTLLLRRVEPFDNVVPAGRSVTALNALRLADLLADSAMAERAGALFAATPDAVHKHPGAFSQLLIALDYALDRPKEIAIVGAQGDPAMAAMLAALREGFHPNMVIASGPASEEGSARLPLLEKRRSGDGKVTAYVCEQGVCQLPTTAPAEAARLAFSMNPLVPAPSRSASE